jgi:hypothetical protein
LIDINQTLTTDSTPSTASAGGTTSPTPVISTSPASTQAHALAHKGSTSSAASQPLAASTTTASSAAAHLKSPLTAPGNLSIPATNPSAERVGDALNGRTRTQSLAGSSFGVQ